MTRRKRLVLSEPVGLDGIPNAWHAAVRFEGQIEPVDIWVFPNPNGEPVVFAKMGDAPELGIGPEDVAKYVPEADNAPDDVFETPSFKAEVYAKTYLAKIEKEIPVWFGS